VARTTTAGRSTATGPHYRIVCDFENQSVADAALRIAEATWPIAGDLLDLPAAPLPKPLELYLYQTVEKLDFAKSERATDADQKTLALSLPERGESHIAVQPMVSESVLATVGLPSQTRGLIAYHAARLATGRASPFSSVHPNWYAAGLAQWVSLRTLRTLGLLTDETEDPLWSHAIWSLQHWKNPEGEPGSGWANVALLGTRTAESIPSASDILAHDLPDVDADRFIALAWANFETLMTPPFERTTRLLLRDVRAIGVGSLLGGEQAARQVALSRCNERAKVLFGEEALARLNGDLRARIGALTPHWTQPYRSLDTLGNDWTQIAYPPNYKYGANAIAWRLDRAPSANLTISGQATILANATLQLNVLLRVDDDDFVQVAFVARQGIYLYEWRSKAWTKLKSTNAPDIAVGQPFSFEVSHRDGWLTVMVNGKARLARKLDRPLDGRWGLGAYTGTAGIWSGIKVTAAGADRI
jgi:hypothetical protein